MTSPTVEERRTVCLDMDHLLLMLLLCISGLPSTGSQCKTTAKADIVLLVDESGSIRPTTFATFKKFFTQLVDIFDISPDTVQIGLVKFSDSPTVQWYLNTYQTKHSLLKAIKKLRQNGGGTQTGRALNYILQNLFEPRVGMRADSQKFVVLITDGQSQDEILHPSQNLKNAGIEIYAIGVDGADKSELRTIASDPDKMYMVSDSSLLLDIFEDFTTNICNSANSLGLPSTGSQCKTTAKADIVLLVDESWSISPTTFATFKKFFTQLVDIFDISPDTVQIGLVKFSDSPTVQWYLNTYQTKHSLLKAIKKLRQNGGGTQTGRALNYILQNLFETRVGMRADSQKFVVLITDGQSQDEILHPSQNLKNAGIEIYAIGVDGADKSELRTIASDPDKMYIVSDSSLLLDIFEDFTTNICNSANSLGLPSTGSQCKTTAKADIVLLVDESGSIYPATFATFKKFFTQLVDFFDISPDTVQIGLVKFSDSPTVQWYLNTYQTKHSLLNAINELQQDGGGTRTGRALNYILQNLFETRVGMRADSQKFVVLITDGQSEDEILRPSQNLKNAGIEIYAIGVDGADKSELRTIASDPDKMYIVSDSSLLLNIFKDFTTNICNSANSLGLPSTGSQCKTTAKADIVLLVDESGSIYATTFATFKKFFTQLVDIFDISPDTVQIGLVKFSDSPTVQWYLNTYQTKHSLLKAINELQQDGGGTQTGRALNYILHDLFETRVGMRADSQKIAVLITDGQSQDEILRPSQNLKNAGIEIYAIGVDGADESELRTIASDPEKMYIVSDSALLLDIFEDFTTNICNSANSLVFTRLVNGTSLCSGRLEVKSNQSNQSWSSVCEDDFDQQDAKVVCQELGCGAPSVLQGALYGEVEAPMWTKEFQCGGNESALLDCRSSGSDRNTSSPGKAVGLTCSDPVRLVGGSSPCAGTLEVKRGEWRPVDGPDWTLKEAAVACAELDCGSAVSAGTRNESLHKPAWKISPECIQSGYTLRECVTSGSSSSIMEITCLEPVRLVGGSSPCAGTLEVKRGEWRPVAGPDWTLKEAAVACAELDCGSAVSAGTRNESLHKPAWKISPECIQSGYTLRECVTSGSSSSIMEITCLDSVRLVNGTSLCSGRLEVKSNQSNQSNQSWSSVCEADFDQQDADVVCRELGCGAPSVLQGALYGEVEAPMWTKEFQCGGNESALLDCRSSGSDRNTSSPGKAVGLTCSEPVRLVGGSSRCAGTLEVKRGDWRPVAGPDWTLESAVAVCRKLDCVTALSAGRREDSSNTSAWTIRFDCVRSGSAVRECVASLSWSPSILELTCLDPAAFIIRLVVLPLILLFFITVIYFILKATRGKKPGPQDNIRPES